ncbi:MAG: DNA repair protein RadC [Muribaculaceae bacterium]|nr:DNA repair protein RadC [Muribaculaceae bacterium]
MNTDSHTPYEAPPGAPLIRELDPEMRPREKALRHGIDSLSDAELMAIIFATGLKGKSVIELSRDILHDNRGHLSRVVRMSPKEMCARYKGIGEAKALTLLAALKLGERTVADAMRDENPAMTSPQVAYDYMAHRLVALPHEEFWVVYLNRALKVISERRVGQGGVSGTAVDVRLVVKGAIEELASAMLIFHNHPSGNLNPSPQDESITRKIRDAAALFDIRLNDHIIVTPGAFYSFHDHGKI